MENEFDRGQEQIPSGGTPEPEQQQSGPWSAPKAEVQPKPAEGGRRSDDVWGRRPDDKPRGPWS
jgi:hypothetical protein